MDATWKAVLEDYLNSPKFKELADFIESEYRTKTIYPHFQNIYSAFNLTSFEATKVVILGQDPYHSEGQAQGLSFSVPSEVRNPPSLKNIFKELKIEFGKESSAENIHNGDLTCWAKQGVLLLNSVLTVRAGEPGSHKNIGWEDFTDYVIQQISNNKENVVFLLWGNYAKAKKELINTKKHLVLESVHPSPFSARNGFFGADHFLLANNYLESKDIKPIVW